MHHSFSLANPATLLALALATSSAGAQTLLFDFGGNNTTVLGPAPDDPVNAWNNITGTIGLVNGAELPAAVNTANEPTGINLLMLSRFNGINEAGTQTSGTFPTDATRDSMFGNTETFGAGADFFPSFKLTGLDPVANHNLTFYASRTGVSDIRETSYTVTGATVREVFLDAANNINATAVVDLIKPDAAGEITVTLGPGPNNNNANHFTYLGAMKLEVVPVQQPIVFSDEPDDATVALGRPVTFTAAVNSTPPYTVQWKKDNVDIPDATQFSYTIPAVSLDMDNTRYSVTVSNLGFTGTSRQALLRVVTDVTPPTLVSASSAGPYHIAVVFSEEIGELSAEDPANYLIDGGNAPVMMAELLADRKTVVLTLGQALMGTLPVQVSNVLDLAGNSLAANATVPVTITQPDGTSFFLDFGGGDTTEQGGGNDDRLNVWNNVTTGLAAADGAMLSDLVRNNGDITPVALTIVSRFNSVNTDGTQLPAPFPVDATRDTLYGNTEVFGGLENVTPVFRFSGLNPAEEHDLVLYASRMNVADNRETRYTVTGASTAFADLNVGNNAQNSAVFNGVRPNELGEITIALTPGPNNNNANHFIYLGVLKMTPRTSTGPLELLKPVVVDGRIILNWIGTGALEWSTALTGTWTPVLPAPTPPYSEEIVVGQRKFFRIRP